MKIRFIRAYTGRHEIALNAQDGDVVELEEELARHLVFKGRAVYANPEDGANPEPIPFKFAPAPAETSAEAMVAELADEGDTEPVPAVEDEEVDDETDGEEEEIQPRRTRGRS